MKQIAILSAVLLALPALAGHGHGGGTMRAHLSGYNEVPVVSTVAEGDFAARMSADGMSVEWAMQFSGLSSPVTQAHIHFAQAAVNGPIVVWLCGTTANPGPAGTQTCPQQGNLSGTITAASVLASPPTQQLGAGELAELVAAMRVGAAYVNIHTATSPGGEVRGQVRR
jgi:hypothetical protein